MKRLSYSIAVFSFVLSPSPAIEVSASWAVEETPDVSEWLLLLQVITPLIVVDLVLILFRNLWVLSSYSCLINISVFH